MRRMKAEGARTGFRSSFKDGRRRGPSTGVKPLRCAWRIRLPTRSKPHVGAATYWSKDSGSWAPGLTPPCRQIGTLLLYLREARIHKMEPRSTPRAEPRMSLNRTTQYLLGHKCPSIGIVAVALPPRLVRFAVGGGAVQRRMRWPTARRASARRGALAAVRPAGGIASRASSSHRLWGVP